MVADSNGHQIVSAFEAPISQRRMLRVDAPETLALDCEALSVCGQFVKRVAGIEALPATSFRTWPVLQSSFLAISLRFRNQEVQRTTVGIPIQLGIPTLLFKRVDTLGDPGKVVATEVLKGSFDFFDTAHTVLLYRLWRKQRSWAALETSIADLRGTAHLGHQPGAREFPVAQDALL